MLNAVDCLGTVETFKHSREIASNKHIAVHEQRPSGWAINVYWLFAPDAFNRDPCSKPCQMRHQEPSISMLSGHRSIAQRVPHHRSISSTAAIFNRTSVQSHRNQLIENQTTNWDRLSQVLLDR